MKTVRLALLSDLHIDSVAKPSSMELAQHAFETALAEDVDHVVVCGDLFDSSTAARADGPAVQRMLKGLGIWKADRLSVVVGNHDIFPVGHYRKLALANPLGSSDSGLRAFARWAGPLVARDQRLYSNALFPAIKRIAHVRLVLADTVAGTFLTSASGFWYEDDDEALRRALSRTKARVVLAIHNDPMWAEPALSDPRAFVGEALRGQLLLPRGYPEDDYMRLERFVEDTAVAAVLTGHVHVGVERTRRFGSAPLFLEGRTGGVEVDPTISFVTVPRQGKVTRRTIAL